MILSRLGRAMVPMLALACESTPLELQNPPPPPPPNDTIQPVQTVTAFEELTNQGPGLSPVLAEDRQGTLHLALIDQPMGGPSIGPIDGPRTLLDRTSNSSFIALLSADDGLHALWNSSSGLKYARLDPQDYSAEIITVGPNGTTGADLAVSKDGARVVVAYVQDGFPEDVPHVMVTEGNTEQGFQTAVRASPRYEPPPPARPGSVERPALQLDSQGTVHLVFSYRSSYEGGGVHYTTLTDGTWSDPIMLNRNAEGPALTLLGTTPVVALLKDNAKVAEFVHIIDGAPQTPVLIADTPLRFDRLVIASDIADVLHFGLESFDYELGQALTYHRSDDPGATLTIAQHAPDSEQEVALSPSHTAGGLLTTAAGSLYVGYYRGPRRSRGFGDCIVAKAR